MDIKPEYYNEFNPDAAAWLRDLIKAGELPEGDVDERSIADVRPDDLKQYHRCHFFAGIGLWPYALRIAGFPADEPVWTGSCPCQPYSSAGKQKGEEDPRHLWPTWSRLISECKPPTVFGEQVAAAIGKGWLDLVQSDLEREGYAVGKAVLSAASVGAPHIRQRLYFVADAQRGSAERRGFDMGGETGTPEGSTQEWQRVRDDSGTSFNFSFNASSVLADSSSVRCNWGGGSEASAVQGECPERSGEQKRSEQDGFVPRGSEGLCGVSELADPSGCRRREERAFGGRSDAGDGTQRRTAGSEFSGNAIELANSSPREGSRFGQYAGNVLPFKETEGLRVRRLVGGFWGDASWLWCRDQKYRPVEPSTFPLSHGLPISMGKMPIELQGLAELAGLSKQSLSSAKLFRKSSLQGFGNAIVPQVAAEFISAYLESR